MDLFQQNRQKGVVLFLLLIFMFQFQMILFNYLVSILIVQSLLIDASKWPIITDNLLLARCEIICELGNDNCDIEKCAERISETQKYGICPKYPKNDFARICLNLCEGQDYKCSDVQKCCPHDCGRSCQEPEDLELISFLPPIPENITVRESDCRTVDISWDILSKEKHSIIYVLEARMHIGKQFAEHNLKDWQFMEFRMRYESPIFSNRTVVTGRRTVAQVTLRPGRWYQFRVAAINVNGTKGYSDYSKGFQLKIQPDPPKPPQILKILKLYIQNNLTYNLIISWSPTKSELPIIKYKISWSKFLPNKEENHSLFKDSLVVNESQRFCEIRNLDANKSYYIQVQSISMLGKRRLVSDTTSRVINTTHDHNVIEVLNQKYNPSQFLENGTNPMKKNRGHEKHLTKKLSNINIKILPDKQYGMVVKVEWKKIISDSLLDLCKGSQDSCFKTQTNFSELFRVRVRKNFYEFKDLNFDSNYIVRLSKFGAGKNPSKRKNALIRHFRTPTCEKHRRTYPYLNLKC